MTTTTDPDDDSHGEIDEQPGPDKPPPKEWTDPEFPADDDDITDDTHDDVTEVNTT